MKKILLVEDDHEFRIFMRQLLIKEGYQVEDVDNPIEAIGLVAKYQYDLLVTDLWMQEMNGIRLAQTVKNIQTHIKVIILTADPNDDTEFESIDEQIDLYISKDKSPKVLMKYVQSVLDRHINYDDDEILYSRKNGIKLNRNSHEVMKDDEMIKLTTKEFELLELLLKNVNKVLSREEILDALWEEPAEEVDPRVIDVHIRNLRTKLKVFSITTIRGIGYKWNE